MEHSDLAETPYKCSEAKRSGEVIIPNKTTPNGVEQSDNCSTPFGVAVRLVHLSRTSYGVKD